MSGKVEAARGIVRNCVQRSGVTEHGWGELVESVVGRLDADKVGHGRVDGGGLAEAPRNCLGVVDS